MKKFDIHEWQAKIRLAEQFTPDLEKDDLQRGAIQQMMDKERQSVQKYNGLPIRDNVMDYASEILNQIEDYKNNVGPGEIPISYIETIAAVEALQTAVDNDEADMDTIAQRAMGEVEVTGMEPDMGNMEKEYKVIGPKNQMKPLEDVTIEYNGKIYELDFEYGDVIDDHGNEGQDLWFEATAEDGTYFMVDAYASNYEANDVDEVFWKTLEITPSKLEPEEIDEQNSLAAAGSGASVTTGASEALPTKNAFKKKNK